MRLRNTKPHDCGLELERVRIVMRFSAVVEVLVGELDQENLFVVVDLTEFDLNDLASRRGDGAADEAGFNGKLAVSAVDEDEQLHALGAPLVEESIEGRTDGTAGVEDVVHQDDVAAIDVEADFAFFDHRARACSGEVVAIEADVEYTGIDGRLLNGLDELGDALGKGNAAALDADEANVGAAVIALDDLVCKPDEGALYLGGGHEPALLAELWLGGGGSGCGGLGEIAHGLPFMIAADGKGQRASEARLGEYRENGLAGGQARVERERR
jgi:hypothetical protein